MAGFAKTLLPLVEYLAGEFGELRPQLVTCSLQVRQALLMCAVLFA